VYDPPMTFTILSGRWDGNTGCPAKSSTKRGHPTHMSSDYICGRQTMQTRSFLKYMKSELFNVNPLKTKII
jgi:hypothetical protein